MRTYAHYLASPLWKGIRERVFKNKGRVCKLCGGRADIIHHLRYGKSELMGTRVRDLVPLCRDCHHKLEFHADGTKRKLLDVQNLYKALKWQYGQRRAATNSPNNSTPTNSLQKVGGITGKRVDFRLELLAILKEKGNG